MIHKCSLLAVLEIFFKEPTKIHFIREISRKIGLAHTSVGNHIKELLKEGLIIKKESRPFNGFIANRDSEKFIFYKKSYNLYSLYELKKEVSDTLHPKEIILFGSYAKGEDIEASDVDIALLSKSKKKPDLEKVEKSLQRKITFIITDNFDKLDEPLKINISKGIHL